MLFVLDYYLSSMTGLELYDQLHAVEGLERTPVLLMTADLPKAVECEVEQRGFPILRKPFDIDDLLRTVEKVIA